MMTQTLIVQQGRRATDWVIRAAGRVYRSAGNILEIWKDERLRWSTRRILLWAWTGLGFWALRHEVVARVYVVNDTIITPHFLSNAWIQAWTLVETAFIVAVFGPVVADYLKNAAPAIASISSAVRDAIKDLHPPPTAGVQPSNPEVKQALQQASAFGGTSND